MVYDITNLNLEMAVKEIEAGGPGSGCSGDNCGRPSKDSEKVNSVISILEEKYPVNPDNSKERIFLVSGKKAGDFEITEREGRLRIKSIQSDTPGSGVGSLILHRILKVADAESVTVELTAASKGSQFLSTEQLKNWYGKHGFKSESGYDEALGYMIRLPKLKEIKSSVDDDTDILIEGILSSKDNYEDTGEYDEELEANRRSNAMFIGYYCENGPTYDPSGKYLCKTCKARDLPDSCAWVSGKISMDAGSCMIYMTGKSSEQSLPVKLTQIQTQYTERPNVKAFGCSRCEYGKEAKEEDNAGRNLWCKFWGMHVMEPACCMKNEGEDDILAPGDKEIEATNHDDNLRKTEDIKMGLYAEQILDSVK